MTFRQLFDNWGLTKVSLKTGFAEAEFAPIDGDQTAAWEMYVELLTRVTTQALRPGDGDERTALESVHSLFQTTREILKQKGRDAETFTKVAIIILNQIVRPFTAKWHKKSLDGAFEHEDERIAFRAELQELQKWLTAYARLLADMANVEDLTDIAPEGD